MASTKARTAANRRNSKHSTGPRTPAGKKRSAANALKHGLTGDGMCLQTEDAREVLLMADRLAEELCPVTAEELFFVRRAAMLNIRVDRCYLKEAFNLRMAVRDAIPNHDRKIFEEVRAIVHQFPEDPYGSLQRLKQTAQGVDFMIDHWRALRDSFAASGILDQTELERTDQLTGRRYDATGKSRFRELSFMVETGLEHVDGELRTSPEQTAACQVRSKLEFEALLSRQIEDLLAHRATLPLADAERSRQEAPMRAVVDLSHQGQLLRRYENAAARELTKIFTYFDNKKADEALADLAATPEPVEESVELASFGNLSEPEPEPPAVEPEPEPETAVERTLSLPKDSIGLPDSSRPASPGVFPEADVIR